MKSTVETVQIEKWQIDTAQGMLWTKKDDLVVIEEPLQLIVRYGKETNRQEKNLAITMRTPSHDFELAMGFLFTEGIIRHAKDVLNIRYCETVKPEEKGNVLKIELQPYISLEAMQLDRHFYTTSSCGICGKTSLDAVQAVQCFSISPMPRLMPDFVCALPEKLLNAQTVFRYTGGIHAAALFDDDGELVLLREDIGRHNALDKLIGAMLAAHLLPTKQHCILVSGRAGFELVQKCAVAGIPALVSIGAPSSLSVAMAKQMRMQLWGFVKNNRANQYA